MGADVPSCQQALANLYRSWGAVRLEYGAVLEAQTYYELCLQLRPEDSQAKQGLGASLVAEQEQATRRESRQKGGGRQGILRAGSLKLAQH